MMRASALSALLLASAAPGGATFVTDEMAMTHNISDIVRDAAEGWMLMLSAKMGADTHSGTLKAGSAQDPNPLLRTMLDKGEGGSNCLDGSPYGYYFRPAPAGSKHANEWVMFMQGGGLCLTAIDCWIRTKNELGTSKVWRQNYTEYDNVLASDPAMNPFWDFNHVWLPYCSGDTHTGGQTRRNGYGLFFSGANNFEASVARLQKLGLDKATRVLLTGSSAGGIGTMNNADRLQALVPQAQVMAMPAGGFFFPESMELSETQLLRKLHIIDAPVYVNSLMVQVVTSLWESKLPPACVAAVNDTTQQYKCWGASVNYNYIKTPMLVVENLYDQLQVDDLFLCFSCQKWDKQFIAYFGEHMFESLSKPPTHSDRRSSIWAPACYIHTSNLCMGGSPKVQGQSLMEVAAAWYFDGKDSTLLDECHTSASSQPCNANCTAHSCGSM
eukprot:Hpha_TRINITY_DN10112_c0_g2::TRINITY_DN10112_c0_g2_i1::g.131669::m.131669/K19882/NOTUM; O-palmitoleoyl-L-serine hydrolase